MYARSVAVVTFDPQYRAATEAVALLDRSARGRLAVSGPQAAEFLDSLLSNDIAGLRPGAGIEATLLTHKGRMLAEVRVLCTEDELALDTERVSLQALFDALQRFRVGYDVDVHKRTLALGLLSLIGPGSDGALTDPPGPAEHAHHGTTLDGRAVRVIRSDVGIDVLCESEEATAVSAALERAGAVEIEEAVAEAIRIEHGRPRFGVDIDEDTMPEEAGIHERSVSYSKGCYIGQETVARLHWKGRPNRHLRGLRLSEPLAPGTPLLLGGRQVAVVGSVTTSPRLGPIALALVRREAEAGALLATADGASHATVVDLPF